MPINRFGEVDDGLLGSMVRCMYGDLMSELVRF